VKLFCTKCGHPFEVEGDVTGQMANCPSCGESFAVPTPQPVAVPEELPPAALNKLRDPGERTAYGVVVALSVLGALLLVLWTILSVGGILLIIGILALATLIGNLLAAAHIKANAVEVTERQFPEVHAIISSFARRLRKEPPAVYVMQQNVWNAFAAILAGKRYVVLYSGAIDSLLLKGSKAQLAWLIGHELGHHFSGQLDFTRRMIVGMGAWLPWIDLWYSRRCELTCDRYGLACSASLIESLRATCNMSVGAQLAQSVDIAQAIGQWHRHRGEFFVWLRTVSSTHPQTLWRMEALVDAAREMGFRQ